MTSWEVRAVDYLQKTGGNFRPLKHYRCGQCRARRRLNRELWGYVRPPRCTSCGAIDWRYDGHRTKEYRTRKGVYARCYCDGLTHPHRPGSSVWCHEHPTGPTEADFIERYGP